MAEAAFVLDVHFERVNCCNCGVPFAMPVSLVRQRRDDHHTFTCPNGHSQHFTKETEAERLKALLDAETERHRRTIARLNTAEKESKKLAKKMKRVNAGVCPCCNRTFINLQRHMATKHADQVKP